MPLLSESETSLLQKNQTSQDNISTHEGRLKKRLIEQIKIIVQKNSLSELILVLDSRTSILLTYLATLIQLLAAGVTLTQKLSLKRKKQEKHALYFIEPNQETISLLLSDYQNLPTQYKRSHVLFTIPIRQHLLRKLASSKLFIKALKRNSLLELHCSSRCVGTNIGCFDIEYCAQAYSISEGSAEREKQLRQQMSLKWLQFLANCPQVNQVNIVYFWHPTKVSQRLAKSFAGAAKDYLEGLVMAKSKHICPDALPVTVILFDRSLDPIAPLLHDFTYQCLLVDTLDFTYDQKRIEADKAIRSLKELFDDTFQRYRYQHITKAFEDLPKHLSELTGKLEEAKQGKGQGISVGDLTTRAAQLRKHIDLLLALKEKMATSKLKQMSQLEQSLATGITSEGKVTSSSTILTEVMSLIKDSQSMNQKEKLRLAMLTVLAIKLSKNDYRQVLQCFEGTDKKGLFNMIAFGGTFDSKGGRTTKAISKEQQNLAKEKMERTKVSLGRWTCQLQRLLYILHESVNERSKEKSEVSIFKVQTISALPMDDNKLALRLDYSSPNCLLYVSGGLTTNEAAALRVNPLTHSLSVLTDQYMSSSSFMTALQSLELNLH